MDNESQIPSQVPATITRSRALIDAIMTHSLREQGYASRTAAAWRWVLTGHGPSPVTLAAGPRRPPNLREIEAEARARDTADPECATPLSRFDPDLDRRQARQVLRWVTGDADAIPLQDPDRGRYVGARLHFVRTDEEIRRVRGWALHGIRQHGDMPEQMSRWEAEHPWRWPAGWMNAAWLHGTVAHLDWILGERREPPLSFRFIHTLPPGVRTSYGCPPTAEDITLELCFLGGVVMQGHEHQPPAEPDEYPPPQWGEAVDQAHNWLTGEDSKPPADHHGCGAYYPCPGQRRCLCEAAGYCLRGQCPACTDKICNAAWVAIEENY